MTLVLDAGALIGYDRRDEVIESHLLRARRRDVNVATTSGVVAQAWRGGSRQARLALLLRGVDEVELDGEQARRIGPLLGAARTSDVVDGSVADIARDGDEILTSDPVDIARLVAANGKAVTVTPV